MTTPALECPFCHEALRPLDGWVETFDAGPVVVCPNQQCQLKVRVVADGQTILHVADYQDGDQPHR